MTPNWSRSVLTLNRSWPKLLCNAVHSMDTYGNHMKSSQYMDTYGYSDVLRWLQNKILASMSTRSSMTKPSSVRSDNNHFEKISDNKKTFFPAFPARWLMTWWHPETNRWPTNLSWPLCPNPRWLNSGSQFGHSTMAKIRRVDVGFVKLCMFFCMCLYVFLYVFVCVCTISWFPWKPCSLSCQRPICSAFPGVSEGLQVFCWVRRSEVSKGTGLQEHCWLLSGYLRWFPENSHGDGGHCHHPWYGTLFAILNEY